MFCAGTLRTLSQIIELLQILMLFISPQTGLVVVGDGCRIDFPVCMYSKVRWYPVVYGKNADGEVEAKKRNFEEICYVSVKKVCV